jgi:hypothetical protein
VRYLVKVFDIASGVILYSAYFRKLSEAYIFYNQKDCAIILDAWKKVGYGYKVIDKKDGQDVY